MGYHQQPGYPEALPQIVAALRDWIGDNPPIDAVVHGGDMIDTCRDALVAEAAALFDLPVPVRLCLGNHDLTAPDSLDRWLSAAPTFFPGGAAEFTLATRDARIHIVPNQWGPTPYCWDGAQDPRFSPAQHRWLSRALAERTDLPHLLVTHCPAAGLPAEQTGMDAPHHAPPEPFAAEIAELARVHPHLRCVLGAHNHMTMHVRKRGLHLLTTSSLAETPFEAKLVEIDRRSVRITTLSLQHRLPLDAAYDADRAYVQGRPQDRTAYVTLL